VTEAPEGPSDEALVLRAQAGDDHALDLLLRRHQADITRILWRFTRRPADLDDLVQDVLLRVLRNLGQWRQDKPFQHWLRRITVNVGRDYCRRGAVARKWVQEPSADPDAPAPEAVESSADPADRAAAAEVRSYLVQLPPNERVLLTLHYLEGWDFQHIGELLGWSAPVTKLRAFRARQRLRSLLPLQELS
jgi:RNA polymerase sigma-70 factor (ECF subfamily)